MLPRQTKQIRTAARMARSLDVADAGRAIVDDHERRPGHDPHARRRRRHDVLHEPGDERDALRRRARHGARDARRARAVRGRRHRRGRRLRPHGRRAGVHVAAPRAGPRQRAGQPPQRPPGGDARGQHRRRPRHVPRPLRRPAALRHRHRGPQRVGLDRAARAHGRSVPRHGRGRRRGDRPARPGGHADPAGRRVVERRRRPGARRCRRGAPAPVDAEPSSRSPRCCAPASRSRCCSADPRCGVGRSPLPPASPPAPTRGCSPRRSCPHRARRRHPAHREDSSTSREMAQAQLAGAAPPRARRRRFAGVVLRLPRQAERPRTRRDATVHVLAAPGDDAAGALDALADIVGAATACRPRPPARRVRPARSPAPNLAAAVGRGAARGGDRVRRERTRTASGWPRRRPAARRTTGCN